MQNSRLSPAQQVSPNFYFDRLLLLQAYKISDKKVQRSYVSWYWRVMQNLKKNQFVVSKMTRIWWILIWALKSLKNLHFDWSLSCKVHNVWPKKVLRSYLSWYWRVMQIWRKTAAFRFGKWHEEFGKFSPEQTKISKCSSLESTEELCLMALKIGKTFEGKLTCTSKNDMRNLERFHQRTCKSQNWDFDGILLSKVENVWA